MPNFHLPFQLGKTYRIAHNATAHTHTVFSNRMQNQSPQILADALDFARDGLVYTIQQILAISNMLGPDNAPSPVHSFADNFNNAFMNHFSVDVPTAGEYKDLLTELYDICLKIDQGLSQSLQIVDINIKSQNGLLNGYVRRYDSRTGARRRGRIHGDFGRIVPASEWEVAHTLVHEASHKFAHTKDHAYVHEDVKIANLSTQKLLDNADSIASMVIETYQNRLR